MPVLHEIREGLVPVKVYTGELEASARQQLINVSKLPVVHHHVAAMPDVHHGIGATVGSVIPTLRAIIPAAVGVDIGCFTGDTRIPLLDGTEATLTELAEGGGEHWVYAIGEEHRITGAKATARLTRRDAALMMVQLDNGEQIICTPDHRFMLRDGTWCEAQHLDEGASLMPLYRRTNKKGYTEVVQPNTRGYQRFHWALARTGALGHLRVNAHKRHAHGYNHKVRRVERLDRRENVYCLTVPGYENFALSAGVFVHNCGMIATRVSLTANQIDETSLKRVFAQISRDVPVGFNQHDERDARDHAAKRFARGLKEILEKHPGVEKRVGKHSSWVRQMGTLGGGNHFIEVCLDEAGRVWVMLHSGSRGIGNAIGSYFIELARKDAQRNQLHLPDRDLAYFAEGARHFDDYVEAVGWAQDYARANRDEMMDLVLEALRRHLPSFEVTGEAVNCHHNYVERETHFGENVWLTRKGAIRARAGELGIIPGSMGTRSYIVRGRGSAESFQSCAHGAGRRMSRTQAEKRFSVSDLVEQTKDVICRKDKGVLDEIPGAYKDIDEVMQNQTDLVEVVHTLKQVLCVKG